MVTAKAPAVSIVRKRTKKFKRFQSDRFARISRTSWRRPRGIDGAYRRGYSGRGKMVKIGFGNDKRTRFIEKNTGFIRTTVHNEKELEALLMHNRKYSVTFASSVGQRLRQKLMTRAKELDLYVNNPSKLKSEE